MGDENHGHAALGLLGKQEIGDLLAGIRIQISGWLVGDQYSR